VSGLPGPCEQANSCVAGLDLLGTHHVSPSLASTRGARKAWGGGAVLFASRGVWPLSCLFRPSPTPIAFSTTRTLSRPSTSINRLIFCLALCRLSMHTPCRTSGGVSVFLQSITLLFQHHSRKSVGSAYDHA